MEVLLGVVHSDDTQAGDKHTKEAVLRDNVVVEPISPRRDTVGVVGDKKR